MMRNGIWLVLGVFLLSHCSSKKERTPSPEEEYEYVEKKNDSITMCPTPNAVPIKNTATYHTVVIREMKFDPMELKAHKGDTVLWINKDITDHDVTELIEKRWSSSKIPMNKSWSMVVDRSADYFCSIHVVMTGKLQVE